MDKLKIREFLGTSNKQLTTINCAGNTDHARLRSEVEYERVLITPREATFFLSLVDRNLPMISNISWIAIDTLGNVRGYCDVLNRINSQSYPNIKIRIEYNYSEEYIALMKDAPIIQCKMGSSLDLTTPSFGLFMKLHYAKRQNKCHTDN